MKRLISLIALLLVAVTVLTSCQLITFNKTETVVVNGVEYTCSGKAKKAESFWVSGLADKNLTDVVIESSVNGKPVTKIAENAFISCT